MFIASAANNTLQGRAIHSINERWGTNFQSWAGRETIGIPVCKKKYAPFDFKLTQKDKHGKIRIDVVRMYGCACHSHLRENSIRCHGERKGWEPFGQWSMKKALALAKKWADNWNASKSDHQNGSFESIFQTSCDENNLLSTSLTSSSCSGALCSTDVSLASWKRLCHNGKCAWKLKHKYDDIMSEMHERSQSG